MSPGFNFDNERSAMGNEKLYRRPNVDLLNGKQWQYVKRCYRLSSREVEVAKLICSGFDNDEVAGNLKIRGGTVKTHLRNIYRRVRVNNKIEMLLRFVEMTIDLYGKQPKVDGGVLGLIQGQAGSSVKQVQEG